MKYKNEKGEYPCYYRGNQGVFGDHFDGKSLSHCHGRESCEASDTEYCMKPSKDDKELQNELNKCYYCGATETDLINRGDGIPFLYRINALTTCYCFRCSDEAYYGIKSQFIKDPLKQKEAFDNFKRKD